MIRKISQAFGRSYRDEPFPIAVWNLVTGVARACLSVIQSALYNAPGLRLGPNATVRGAKYIYFGKNVYIHSGVWMEAVTEYRSQRFIPRIEIGDNVSMSHGVHLSCIQSLVLKSGVLLGSHVYISDHGHGNYRGSQASSPLQPPAERALVGGPVLIEENVWVGDNAIITGPIRIGAGAIIGANSVVKTDVPPQTIFAGIPARAIKQFDPIEGTWNKL